MPARRALNRTWCGASLRWHRLSRHAGGRPLRRAPARAGSARPAIGLIRSIARPPQRNGRLRSLNEMEAEMLSKGPRGAANRLLSRKEAAAFLTELGLRRSAQTLARLFCER